MRGNDVMRAVSGSTLRSGSPRVRVAEVGVATVISCSSRSDSTLTK